MAKFYFKLIVAGFLLISICSSANAIPCGDLGEPACQAPPPNGSVFCRSGKISKRNQFCTLSSYDDTSTLTLKPIGARYVGESTSCVWQPKSMCPPYVTYLSTSQLTGEQIYVKNGLVYKGNILFDTKSADMGHCGAPCAIYVMSPNGNLYVSNYHKVYRFHHSSFLRGGDVAGAGELQITQGKVTYYSNCSGHYLPTDVMLDQFEAQLKGMGVDLSSAKKDVCSLVRMLEMYK